MAGSINVADAVSGYNANTSTLTDQMVGLNSDRTDLANQQAANLQQAGADDALVTQTKDQGLLDAQDRTTRYQDALAPEDKIAQLSQDFWNNYTAAQAYSDQILAKRQSSILDDPLQAISDHFTIGNDIQVHNVLADKANTALAASQNISQAVSMNAASNLAAAKVATAQSVAAASEAVSLKAKVQADQLRQAGIGYQADTLQALQTTQDKQLGALIQAHSAANSDASLAISQQSLALAKSEAARHAAEFDERMAQKNENASDLADYADKVNAGRKIYNLPPMNAVEIKRVVANDPNGKAKFTEFYQAGAVAVQTGVAQISDSPNKSAILLAANRGTLPAGASKVQQFINDGLNSGVAALQKPGLSAAQAKPTFDNINAAMGNQLQVTAQKMLSDRSAPITKSGNIYAAPAIPAMALLAPGVTQTPLYQVVLQPLVAIGSTASDPEQIVAAGLAAVKAGKLSQADLVNGISTYYGAANVANSAAQNYKVVGLPEPTGYVAKVANGGANPFRTKDTIDFTNPVQVSRYVTTRMVNSMIGDSGTGMIFDPAGAPMVSGKPQ